MTETAGLDIRCIGCGKTPDELPEYVDMADVDGWASATEAVQNDEGTYNRATGHFACTECYVDKLGMPSSPRGWVAP